MTVRHSHLTIFDQIIGHIDAFNLESDSIHARGWVVQLGQTSTTPETLLRVRANVAYLNGSTGYIDLQLAERSDISAYYQNPAYQNSGWCFTVTHAKVVDLEIYLDDKWQTLYVFDRQHYQNVVISLGWNCAPAIYSSRKHLRPSKNSGFHTCPFDLMLTNLPGVIRCLKDDFADFMNEAYLTVKTDPESAIVNLRSDPLIHNTKYNFIFNHESPGHANLYQTQNWTGGINHFVDNSFKLLKERYNSRVDNFRTYLSSNNKVNFIISRFNPDLTELTAVLTQLYPQLNFEIHRMTPSEGLEFVKNQYRHQKLDDCIIAGECLAGECLPLPPPFVE